MKISGIKKHGNISILNYVRKMVIISAFTFFRVNLFFWRNWDHFRRPEATLCVRVGIPVIFRVCEAFRNWPRCNMQVAVAL